MVGHLQDDRSQAPEICETRRHGPCPTRRHTSGCSQHRGVMVIRGCACASGPDLTVTRGLQCIAQIAPYLPPTPEQRPEDGHTSLLHGFGSGVPSPALHPGLPGEAITAPGLSGW